MSNITHISLGDLIGRLYPDDFDLERSRFLEALQGVERIVMPIFKEDGDFQGWWSPVKINATENEILISVALPVGK